MKLYEKKAFELSEMLRNKQCSAVEILNDVNERIDKTDNNIGAYLSFNENSLLDAQTIDELLAKNEELSYLAGIPIAVKDNISTKGIRTTCASKMLENYIPPYNATVINKIQDAGMILTGKTNMDEFGMGSSTETSFFKPTHNPHNTDYVPGGSSGGSSAAVAAGESILALGSDTGGSVRQPSSYCGVIGLKPTYGRVSRFGLIAYASSLEQIGPIGKCVKDVAMLQTIISGYDKYDSISCAHKTEDFYKLLKADVKGLKIGILKEYFSSDINEEIKNSIYNTLSILEKNGAELKVVSIPMSVYALNSYYILASAEASSNLARYDGVKFGYRTPEYNNLSEMYIKTRSEGFGDEVKRRIMLGTFVLNSDYYEDYYKKAKKMQAVISNEFSDILKDCDILVSPTTTDTAFKIGERINNPIKMINNDFLTVAANITGLPAINVPCGKSSKGLPFGMQFISNKFNEQLLLNTAYAYETYIDGFDFGLKLD